MRWRSPNEIYEHILYDGTAHIPIMQIPGMRDRTILVNSMSKTYSVTGWRVDGSLSGTGFVGLDSQGARLPDGRCGGAMQAGGSAGHDAAAGVLRQARADYTARRNTTMAVLEGAGFRCFHPRGAYLHHDRTYSGFGFENDMKFARASD